MERGAKEDEPSEYVDLLEKLEAAQESDVVEQALSAAREHLGMDAAYITTIDSRQQTIQAILGDPDMAERYQDSVFPVEQTYCRRMLNGEVPNVVPDTRAEPALQGLVVTREIGAYVGVPVRLSDGEVCGSLCCVSRQPKDGIGADELRFMEVLAGIVATRLEQARGDLARLTERFRKNRTAPASA